MRKQDEIRQHIRGRMAPYSGVASLWSSGLPHASVFCVRRFEPTRVQENSKQARTDDE